MQAKLSFWGVLFQVLLGMLLALLLHTQSRVVEFARTFFLIPMVLPPIVVAIIWKLIYTPGHQPALGSTPHSPLLNIAMPSLSVQRRFCPDRDHHRRHLWDMAALSPS